MTRVLVWIAAIVMFPSIAFGQSRVATPTFSVEGGEYSTVVMVVVRVSTPAATIHFTQNGLDPTPSDPIIVSGSTIAVNTTMILKARAFLYGRRPSNVRTAAFTIVSAETGARVGPGDAAAGGPRSLIATPDGRVFAWPRAEAPARVAGLAGIVAVAAGTTHALALTEDRRVFAWGANDVGQLGDGTQAPRSVPVAIPGLNDVLEIAAGRYHSLALTSDGRVWAWGSNDRGQLGVPSSGSSTIPVMVPSLTDIASIEAGNQYSIAVSRSGEVFAWGANRQGQLGDGTRTDRREPVRVALENVVEVAAGATHTLAMDRDGRVFSWGSGSRGQLGTGSLTIALHPRALTELRAYAVRAGSRFSAAVARDGTLMLWGANDVGQLGDGTLIDRPTPVAGPPIAGVSALALGNRHALAVTARGDIWTWGHNAAPAEVMSDVPGWGPPFVPLELTEPTIQPASGAYPAAQTIVLSTSDPGVTIRYTLDGSDPTPQSTAYLEPFVVATTSVLKARAYSSDGSADPSEVVSAEYTIDMLPPTIVARLSAEPAEWHLEPVTVTFECADDSGTVVCPPPVFVSSEGASQLISGAAVDAAGNRATASLIVNMDLSAPSVALDGSPDNTTTTASQLVLSGQAFDAISGLDGTIRCNGRSIPVIQGAFECAVTLRPGVNGVSLQAVDLAGHVAAAGIVVTLAGQPTAVTIAPDSRTMIVNESSRLSLRDEFGAAVADAAWSSSDLTVALLSDDDPPVVTAIAAGTATITAVKDGMSAEASITVDAAALLAPGTTRWTLAPAPGMTMEFPILPHRVDATVPDMFVVETATWRDATLHAATAEGEVLWKQESPGMPLMGDSFGSVVSGIPSEFSNDHFTAYVRLGNAGGVPPWRYDSRGALARPAQAADGTIFAIEFVRDQDAAGDELWDKHAVVIDGRTGRLLSRRLLAREVDIFTAQLDGQVLREQPPLVCASTRREESPATTGPMVGSDGRGYLLVRRFARQKFDTCIETHSRHERTIDLGVDLYILSRDAAPVIEPLHSDACSVAAFAVASCDARPELRQLVPDGIGGVLASVDRFGSFQPNGFPVLQRIVTRRNEAGQLAELPVERSTWIDTVGQGGLSYVFANGAWSAIDVTTWTPRWTAQLGTFGPLAPHPDGGAAIYDSVSGLMQVLGDDGQPDTTVSTVSLGFPYRPLQHFNGWLGTKGGKLHVVAGEFPDATRFYAGGGNTQNQNAVRNPGVGIFLKTHWALAGFSLYKHASIRIVPGDQAFWRAFDPAGFFPRDVYGNHFMTIGAGTGPNDTAITCDGTLTKGRNRDRDVLEKPSSLDAYPMMFGVQENAFIRNLLEKYDNFTAALPYACFPEDNPGAFNSNSFVRGLQDAAGLTAPRWPPGVIAPGWFTPVPAQYFQPH